MGWTDRAARALNTSSAAPPSRPVLSASTTRVVVDQPAACDVDEQRATLHLRDLARADQPRVCRRQRRAEHEHVALRQQRRKIGRPQHRRRRRPAARSSTRRRIAETWKPNGAATLRHFATDRAETDDAHARALERADGAHPAAFELVLRSTRASPGARSATAAAAPARS